MGQISNSSTTVAAIAKALVAAQAQLTVIAKNAENPFFNSKYSDLAAVWEAVRGPLNTNGIAVVQIPISEDGKTVTVQTTFLHTSGEWIMGALTLEPSKPRDPQSVGSAITYAKRYMLAAMAGIASQEEDDDAQAASSPNGSAQRGEYADAGDGGEFVGPDEDLSQLPLADTPPSQVLLPWGKHKGKTIGDPDVPVSYLEWMFTMVRKDITDPSKRNLHAKNVALARELEREAQRRHAHDAVGR